MRRRNLVAATTWLVSLARSGSISAARKVFDEMPERDVVAWNAMLVAYSSTGDSHRALSLFSAMRASAARPDAFSFTALLAASADLRELRIGRMLHALVFRSGLCSSVPVSNSLVDMYGKCASVLEAKGVFDGMEERNEVSWCSLLDGFVNSGDFRRAHELFDQMRTPKVVAWNVLIMGYVRSGDAGYALGLLKKMQTFGVEGDSTTFSGLLNACSEFLDPVYGQMIHATIIQRGWNSVIEVSNSTLSFYAKYGFVNEATKIFESMETRNVVSWNAMIDAYVRVGDIDKALSLFRTMPESNIVSWTTAIAGLSRNGHGELALTLFADMTRNLLRPDELTLGAVLHACAILTILAVGRMVHGIVILIGFLSYDFVGNGLVNMYAKCGDIESTKQAFDSIINKDLVSWNTMLFGYALHGLVLSTLEAFEDMLACDVSPDKFTFVGLLMACSHAGLVERGITLFKMMETVYRVMPDADHVTCCIDMLGRAGYLREARKFLIGCSTVKSRRSFSSCEALLSACTVSGDLDIGRRVGEELVSMEPQKEVGYVMLSNMYSVNGRWKEAEEVRRTMLEQGVKKEPGCSWIEVRERVMTFVSGNQTLGHMMDVHGMIDQLDFELRNPCFSCSCGEV